MKICMVAPNASLQFGGEASLPWLFFKYLRQRGVDVNLVIHARTRPEVLAAFPNDHDRIHFSPETKIDRLLWKIGSKFPDKIDVQTFGVVRHLYNQRFQRKIVRRLIAERGIQLVHEMTPVSPKQVSLMYNLGVPVVIGPLAGGMTYPPAFRHLESRAATAVEFFGRALSHPLNRLMPGKKNAAALIVANDRARNALPKGVRGKIHEIPDAGVDLAVWSRKVDLAPRNDDKIRFVYLGRLADVKGIQFLIPAFKIVADQEPRAVLDLLGDGERRQMLQEMTRQLNLQDRINFVGWVTADDAVVRLRRSDVFVMPSLREVGGIVLLEAMAVGLPVIATDWGGPAIHVTDATGIRVPPTTRDGFIQGFADAMLRLARDGDLRHKMGQAGLQRVRTNLYDWSQKTDRLLEIYAEVLAQRAATI
jgi:glycosyltransferase involved in cell wall biosynthesis